MRQILRSLRMWKKRQPICLPSSLLEASCLRELEHKTKPVERINVVYLYWCDGTKRVWRVQRMRLICKYNALHWLLLPLRAAEKISEQLTRKCGPFDFNRAAERFGSSWEMYGPKKTPQFISKNQLLPFPNLAHLLKAQDQGEQHSVFTEHYNHFYMSNAKDSRFSKTMGFSWLGSIYSPNTFPRIARFTLFARITRLNKSWVCQNHQIHWNRQNHQTRQFQLIYLQNLDFSQWNRSPAI